MPCKITALTWSWGDRYSVKNTHNAKGGHWVCVRRHEFFWQCFNLLNLKSSTKPSKNHKCQGDLHICSRLKILNSLATFFPSDCLLFSDCSIRITNCPIKASRCFQWNCVNCCRSSSYIIICNGCNYHWGNRGSSLGKNTKESRLSKLEFWHSYMLKYHCANIT